MASVYVVTANRTLDGKPVYLGVDRAWRERLDHAHLTTDVAEREALLCWAREREAEVCDPYVLPVSAGESGPVPLSARERIRAAGDRVLLARLGYA